MTKEQKTFIEKIYKSVKKYADKYSIKVYSPIIAQAILESAWGKSELAKYNNFFGLKAGMSYKGETVNFKTKEETKTGASYSVNADFRAFKTVDAGVKGYFDFINTKRYENLKGVTDPKTYLENIKADGYATAVKYVDNVMGVIVGYNLTEYDPQQTAKANVNNKADILDDKAIEKCFDMIASDVIKRPNRWGNGEVRKNRLYNEVQTRINRILTR